MNASLDTITDTTTSTTLAPTIKSPLKAIRAKCIDCCCGSKAEVKACSATTCVLHPFRFGKHPYKSHKKLTEEEKDKLYSQLHNGKKRPVKTAENHEE